MKTNDSTPQMTRRTMLKAVAATGLCAALPGTLPGQSAALAPWQQGVLAYLETLARADGGYAWETQKRSHLSSAHAVAGCYHLLGQKPPNAAKLAEYIRTHHPYMLKKLEQPHHEFEFMQIQALLWLGAEVAEFKPIVEAWKKPYVYLKQYEKSGNPIFRHETAAFTCRKLLGMPLTDLAAEFVPYLEARRREDGSFNGTPAADGSGGNVLNTLWGLEALATLGRLEEKKAETIAWLQGCQRANGGFTHAPKPQFAGVDDVAYTFAAVRALKMLGAAPKDAAGCVTYLHGLLENHKGFRDRAGFESNAMATYHALAALKDLGALTTSPAMKPAVVQPGSTLPPGLKAWSILIEGHGSGSPAEAVDLAQTLRIHLWGAKNGKPGWIARAQAIADAKKVPVKFFVADEEYGTWVKVDGLGTYSHTSDIFAPAGSDIGPSMANKGVVKWEEFRTQRLAPLEKAGGRVVWQFGENEELVRLYLDDSLERGGYAAISTFHFGNPDFTNSEPFLQRYRGKIPYIALQDAHGTEPWWFGDMTAGFRTVFLATEPTYDNWLAALKNNWLAAVRHDAVSNFETWAHHGKDEVWAEIQKQKAAWQWWDNPAIQRPMVSLVAVKPEDEFEAGRPEKGVMLRVRCVWENTTQGLAKRPVTELVKLLVDGSEVKTTVVEKKPPAGKNVQALMDHHHQYYLPNPAAGKHTATVVVRDIATKKEFTRSIEFTG